MTSRNGGAIIRVLVAAASAVRRAGLEALIKTSPLLKLVGIFSGARAIAQHAVESQADVIVLDFERDESHALISSITNSGLPLVVLIDDPEPEWTAQALRSGTKAILPRNADADEIISAIQAAYSGLVLLDPEVTEDLAQRIQPSVRSSPLPGDELTAREVEVLRMLAEGISNRQMAERLEISTHTVKFHISSILDKLDASTRTEAVALGIRMGLILL